MMDKVLTTSTRRALRFETAAFILLGVLLFSIGRLGAETPEPSHGQVGPSRTPLETVQRMHVPLYYPRVIRQIGHLGKFRFTEGLVFYGGFLYESTGWNFQTSLKKIDPRAKGQVLRETRLGPDYFGEGLTIWRNRIYQLSYDTGELFIYSMNLRKRLAVLTYEGEGWGLTRDDQTFIMSNGSGSLYFRDFETFGIIREICTGVENLNELEYVGGIVYANIWGAPYILMIDPADGKVIGKISLESLPDYTPMSYYPTGYTSNGIAYDPKKKTFYITGKNWAYIYEVTFERMDETSRPPR